MVTIRINRNGQTRFVPLAENGVGSPSINTWTLMQSSMIATFFDQWWDMEYSAARGGVDLTWLGSTAAAQTRVLDVLSISHGSSSTTVVGVQFGA